MRDRTPGIYTVKTKMHKIDNVARTSKVIQTNVGDTVRAREKGLNIILSVKQSH